MKPRKSPTAKAVEKLTTIVASATYASRGSNRAFRNEPFMCRKCGKRVTWSPAGKVDEDGTPHDCTPALLRHEHYGPPLPEGSKVQGLPITCKFCGRVKYRKYSVKFHRFFCVDSDGTIHSNRCMGMAHNQPRSTARGHIPDFSDEERATVPGLGGRRRM